MYLAFFSPPKQIRDSSSHCNVQDSTYTVTYRVSASNCNMPRQYLHCDVPGQFLQLQHAGTVPHTLTYRDYLTLLRTGTISHCYVQGQYLKLWRTGTVPHALMYRDYLTLLHTGTVPQTVTYRDSTSHSDIPGKYFTLRNDYLFSHFSMLLRINLLSYPLLLLLLFLLFFFFFFGATTLCAL
jgi:hypothetical protein